jgi:flagella basal body P-ring formation protein FlgA
MGWGWVRFEVWAPAAFTTRPVRAGEPLQAALTVEDREIRSGHAAYVPPPGALAARDLPRGTVLQAAHVAGATLASGESVKVMVMSGPLAIEVQGRAISCGVGRLCAVLPSGRHVEGHLQEGRLLVDVP